MRTRISGVAIDLPPRAVPDDSVWQPSFGAWFHTGENARERARRIPAGLDVAIDIETPSVTDSFSIKCVTAAWEESGTTQAVLLDPLRVPGDAHAVRDITRRARHLILHNSPFDIPGLVAAELLELGDISKVMDTLVLARAAWPDTLVRKRLEDLAGRILGMSDLANALKLAQKASGLTSNEKWFRDGDIHMPLYRSGAIADTVVTLRLAHPLFEAATDRQLDHPFTKYGCTHRSDAAALVLKAQTANQVMLRQAARGYDVNLDYLDSYVDRVESQREQAKLTLTEAGLRPGVGMDLVQHLDSAGHLPPGWPRTAPSKTRPEGTLKTDKDTMEEFLPEHPLADAHRVITETKKILGYMEKAAARSQITGRLHPQFQILGASATGRMCLPTSHSLVTRRGIVAPDDIRVGDETVDRSGSWVPVTAVHRYADAEIHTREWRSFRMECTPEHRWVTHVDGGKCRVEPLTGARRRVQLVPDGDRVDLSRRTLRPSIATVIGLLVSDGRCAVRGNEMRAYVYQTEGGFYDTMRAAIPAEALMYDRVTADTRRGPHHEMRLRTRWLRPVLEGEGLEVSTTLDRCAGLAAWVMRQPMEAVDDFLMAMYLSDGNTAQSQPQITCEHPETQRAVQLAAYRLGRRAYVRHTPASEWGTKPRAVVYMPESDSIEARNKPVTGVSTGDVWCVTTASGTFTAWNGQPYLTGNSTSEPELQQFSEDARPIILPRSQGMHSVDWSSIEPALLGWMAKDWEFITPFEQGADIYEPVQVSAGCARKTAKVVVLAGMYGQGRAKLSRSLGISMDQAAQLQRQMRQAMPKASRFMGQIKQVGDDYGLTITAAGRVLTIPRFNGVPAGYKAVNYCVSPGTPILTADLRHVPAEKIAVGDELVGFDEFSQDSRGRGTGKRFFRTARVEAASTVIKPSVVVVTEDGRETECSVDHLWLVRVPGATRDRLRWMAATDLTSEHQLLSLGVWEESSTRNAGYLAGLFDGEGSMSSRAAGQNASILTFSQKSGLVMDQFRAAMDREGLEHTYVARAPRSSSPCDNVRIQGLARMMRTVGTLRPERFVARAREIFDGTELHTVRQMEAVPFVREVRPIGDRVLTSIQTSTRTLVANGYLSHNCFQGSCADLIYDTIINAEAEGLGDAIMLPMHDEIVCDSEASDDIQRLMSAPPDYLLKWTDGRAPVIRTDAQGPFPHWVKC